MSKFLTLASYIQLICIIISYFILLIHNFIAVIVCILLLVLLLFVPIYLFWIFTVMFCINWCNVYVNIVFPVILHIFATTHYAGVYVYCCSNTWSFMMLTPSNPQIYIRSIFNTCLLNPIQISCCVIAATYL